MVKNRFVKKKIAILFCIVSATIFLFIDFKFRPVVKNISLSKAKNIASSAIDEAVFEDMRTKFEKYESITHFNTSQNGEILSISMDMCKTNELKTGINILIQEKLAKCKEKIFYTPLGTLIGSELLNGQGPKIPMKISSSGNVTSEFRSDFSSAGINQTLHKIYLSIHVHISVTIPGSSCTSEVTDDILVSETVIVGHIPQMCPGLQQHVAK